MFIVVPADRADKLIGQVPLFREVRSADGVRRLSSEALLQGTCFGGPTRDVGGSAQIFAGPGEQPRLEKEPGREAIVGAFAHAHALGEEASRHAAAQAVAEEQLAFGAHGRHLRHRQPEGEVLHPVDAKE